MLLKNNAGLLPLSAPASIAVIGPNAKKAMTSGGGSAQLLSTYTVSPLQGIIGAAKAINVPVSYTVGATSHKVLPLLDASIKQQDGTPGAFLEFWNEPPSSDFMSLQADLSSTLKESVWDTRTLASNCILLDGVVRHGLQYLSISNMHPTLSERRESQHKLLDSRKDIRLISGTPPHLFSSTRRLSFQTNPATGNLA